FVREAAHMPQPLWSGTAKRWIHRGERAGGHSGDREPTRDAVPRLEPRAGRGDCVAERIADGKYPPDSAFAAERRGTAVADRVRESVVTAAFEVVEPRA